MGIHLPYHADAPLYGMMLTRDAPPSGTVPLLSAFSWPAVAPRASNREVRQVLQIGEHGIVEAPAELIAAGSLQIYPEVLRHKLVRLFFQEKRLMLQAGPLVGLLPLNDRLVLDVRPRFTVANLSHLLALTSFQPLVLDEFLRQYISTEDQVATLLDLLATALIRGARQILSLGLHHEYIRRQRNTSFPRGRILLTETTRRHQARNRYHIVSASWHDRDKDTEPNRCLKYAVWSLAQHYQRMQSRKGHRKRLRELNEVFQSLAGVSLVRDRRFLVDRRVQGATSMPDRFSYYTGPLALAAQISRNRGIALEVKAGVLVLSSLFLRMDEIFEKYLRFVLNRHFQGAEPGLAVKDGNLNPPAGGAKPLFDAPPSERATPDAIVFERNVGSASSGAIVAVIEMKYKSYESNPDRDDLNQLITYAASYRSSIAVLVHPATHFGGLRKLGSLGSLDVYQYAFNLARDPLSAEELDFGSALLSLLSARPRLPA